LKEKEINTLLLSGGGPKVTASVTALEKAYNSSHFFFNLHHIAAISAGTILGLLIVLNYTFTEIKEEILNTNISNLISPKISTFIKEWGVETGKNLIQWIECMIIKKGISPKITFKELFDLFPIKFTILAYNISSVEYEFFNYLTTPDMTITEAIRYSINIPCFFTKQRKKGDFIIDLGLISNFPCDIFCQDIENVSSKNDIDNLLGIHIKKNKEYIKRNVEINNFIDYFSRIMNILNVKLNESELTEHHLNHKYKIEICNLNLNATNFNIDKDTINELFIYGEKSYDLFEKKLNSY
jgi:hypothetical protein